MPSLRRYKQERHLLSPGFSALRRYQACSQPLRQSCWSPEPLTFLMLTRATRQGCGFLSSREGQSLENQWPLAPAVTPSLSPKSLGMGQGGRKGS